MGIGCNNFGGRTDEARSERVIHAALDEGVAFFDTADIYSGGRSEEILGRALRDRRDQAVIATKFGGPMGSPQRSGGSRRWIMEAVEDSLRRLDTDHIDLYQHHFFDAATPLEETLGALDELVSAGKVLAIGCSNYDGAQIDEAHRIATEHGWASLRDRAERVQPAQARTGGGVGDARAGAARHGNPALLPAVQRAADRQVPPRRAPAGGTRAWAWTATGRAT